MKLFETITNFAILGLAVASLGWVVGDAVWGKGSGLRPWVAILKCLPKNSCTPTDPTTGQPIAQASALQRVQGATRQQVAQIKLPTHPAVAACPVESVQDRYRVHTPLELQGIVNDIKSKKLDDQMQLPQGSIACLTTSAGSGPVDMVLVGEGGTFLKLRQPKKDVRGIEVVTAQISWTIPPPTRGAMGGGQP